MSNYHGMVTVGTSLSMRVVYQVLGLNGVKQRMSSRKVRPRNAKLQRSSKRW